MVLKKLNMTIDYKLCCDDADFFSGGIICHYAVFVAYLFEKSVPSVHHIVLVIATVDVDRLGIGQQAAKDYEANLDRFGSAIDKITFEL